MEEGGQGGRGEEDVRRHLSGCLRVLDGRAWTGSDCVECGWFFLSVDWCVQCNNPPRCVAGNFSGDGFDGGKYTCALCPAGKFSGAGASRLFVRKFCVIFPILCHSLSVTLFS